MISLPVFSRFRLIMTALLLLPAAAPTQAALTGTGASVTGAVRYSPPYTTDAQDSDSGDVNASVNITGPVTQMSVTAGTSLFNLNDESATVSFGMGFHGNGYTGNGELNGSVLATVYYDALMDSVMDYSWSFDYWGASVGSLQEVSILVGVDGATPTLFRSLGDSSQGPGHFEGTATYAVVDGKSYVIQTKLGGIISGAVGGVDGDLAGTIIYEFNGTVVPLPASIFLFGSGLLACLGVGCRRRQRSRLTVC